MPVPVPVPVWEEPGACAAAAMSFVRALATRLVLNQRKFQEELDVWRLYHLVHYWRVCRGREVRVPRPDEVSSSKQYRAIHSAVTSQLIDLLRLLLSEPLSATSPNTTTAPSPHHHHVNNCSSVNVKDFSKFPFRLSLVKPPSVHEPTPGVELEGHAVPGTVLCFFPGTVYLPPHVKNMPNYPDNPYLMSRTDGSVIDAKDYENREDKRNHFAVGHYVRHPLEGRQPNVMQFSYEVDPNFPSELLPFIPNTYFKKPGFLYSTRSPMRSIVFVAMTHIKNEEIFLNYRLHPGSKLPDWYSSVNPDEDERRWRY